MNENQANEQEKLDVDEEVDAVKLHDFPVARKRKSQEENSVEKEAPKREVAAVVVSSEVSGGKSQKEEKEKEKPTIGLGRETMKSKGVRKLKGALLPTAAAAGVVGALVGGPMIGTTASLLSLFGITAMEKWGNKKKVRFNAAEIETKFRSLEFETLDLTEVIKNSNLQQLKDYIEYQFSTLSSQYEAASSEDETEKQINRAKLQRLKVSYDDLSQLLENEDEMDMENVWEVLAKLNRE